MKKRIKFKRPEPPRERKQLVISNHAFCRAETHAIDEYLKNQYILQALRGIPKVQKRFVVGNDFCKYVIKETKEQIIVITVLPPDATPGNLIRLRPQAKAS